METRHARVVEEVAKLGSIRAASETIGYTQPAITKILRKIEAEIGGRLFERHPRGMRLNEYGEAFLVHALAIEKEMRDAKSKVAALKTGEMGQVIIGTAAFVTQILPEILAELARERPNLKFRIVEGNPSHLEHMLLEGKIDLAVTAISQFTDEQIFVEKLGEVEFGLIAAVYHPLTKLTVLELADLANRRWILAEGDARTSTFLERKFSRNGLPWTGPDIELLPRYALLEIVANTDLISFLPLLSNPGPAPSVVRMTCADLQWRMPAGMSFRKNRPMTAAGRIVFEKIKKRLSVSTMTDGGKTYDSL